MRKIELSWKNTFRIIPSHFPPINFFEELVDPDLMDELYYVENLTNDRLRQEVGDISLVPKEDRIGGKSSSVVMAAFTHISLDRPSRFSNGSYGVYYASKTIETAIYETIHHRENFLRCTTEPPCELTMRVYQSKQIIKPLYDVRAKKFNYLHDPNVYTESQQFGKELKEKLAWGLIYNSVRHKEGECIAIFRPPAIPLPVKQTKHLKYQWNGNRIDQYYEINQNSLQVLTTS